MELRLITQLRHLIELLDHAVQQPFLEMGLDYRPRYMPVMRALAEQPSATIGELAALAGVTQPAATQTVALMIRNGLLTVAAGGADARQRVVRLSACSEALLPRLRVCWQATKSAADRLDAELAFPLSVCLEQTIAILETRTFEVQTPDANVARQYDGGPLLSPTQMEEPRQLEGNLFKPARRSGA